MVRLNFRLMYTSTGNTTTGYSSPKTGFDVSTMVVLAALLSTLMAVFALNSIIQHILRRRREALAAVAAGIEKQVIKKIPVGVFRSHTPVPTVECSICLGDLVDGEKVRVLPECKHEFHVKCVDKWLVEHMSCPNCRCLVALPPDRGGRVVVDHLQYDSLVISFMLEAPFIM